MSSKKNIPPGTVYLIGAGPGDPGLVTLRGIECLKKADVVIYDYLVNPATLEHAPASAELIGLGHHSSGRALTPDEICALMVEEARKGLTVARLKGGDPSIFGRGADEVGALHDAGIPLEIVPGITAGLAVAAYCEIPITHHEDASAVALIAGQERHTKKESHLDFGVLAHFPGTLIFYMGVSKAWIWSQALMDNGKPADTPVAIVRWCTRARQQTYRCTLGTVTDLIEEKGIRPPSLFVVGDVVGRATDISWFTARPLLGVCVLVAGSPVTSRKLRDQLTALGAYIFTQPSIRITDPPDWAPLDSALDTLDEYDWIVFSSGNGVDSFFRRLFDRGGDLRRLGRVKLAVVGTSTAERLAGYHVKADLVPEKFNAEALAEALIGEAKGRRFLLARASRGRQVLADALEAAGARVDSVVVYSNTDVEEPDLNAARELGAGEIDWVTVTSPAAARSLVRLYGEDLRKARLVSMSPLTSAALRELSFEPAAEASPYTTAGLVEAILGTVESEG